MIIDICGLYRSSTTLIYNLLREILINHNLGRPIKNKEQIVHQHVVDKTIYLCKLHDFEEQLELGDWAEDFFFVHSYRDIRDILVSLCEWRKLTLDNFDFQGKDAAQFIDWMVRLDEKWKSKKNLVVFKYEDYAPFDRSNIVVLLVSLYDYLKIPINWDLVNVLADQYQYNRIKEYSDKLIVTDNEKLLNVRHVGNAKVAKWQTYFTEEEKEKYFSQNVGLQEWLIKNAYE